METLTFGICLVHDDLVLIVRVAVESFRIRVGAVVHVLREVGLIFANVQLFDLDIGCGGSEIEGSATCGKKGRAWN